MNLNAAIVAFNLLKAAAIAVYSPVAAIGAVWNDISLAISSATDALADFKKEVSEVLNEMPAAFSTVINPVGSLGSTIASSGQSKADSKADSNKMLIAAIKNIADSSTAMAPAPVQIALTGGLDAFFKVTEDRLNRKMSGKTA